jgi:hypothetical protein
MENYKEGFWEICVFHWKVKTQSKAEEILSFKIYATNVFQAIKCNKIC